MTYGFEKRTSMNETYTETDTAALAVLKSTGINIFAARKDRRVRTVYDFRYFTQRFMKRCPGLGRRRVRTITQQECTEYIEQAFETPRQRRKARLILSGVFGTAVKRGWCDANPVARVEAPRMVEQQVPILTPQEIEQITTTAETYQSGSWR